MGMHLSGGPFPIPLVYGCSPLVHASRKMATRLVIALRALFLPKLGCWGDIGTTEYLFLKIGSAGPDMPAMKVLR